MKEPECLPKIDGTGSWQFGAEDSRDERRAPHALSNDLVEHVAAGELVVHMGRVHVAGHDGEQLDVFPGQCTRQARGLADLDLVESPVLDQGHNCLLP